MCCNSSSFRTGLILSSCVATGLILSSCVATALHLEQVLSFPHMLQQLFIYNRAMLHNLQLCKSMVTVVLQCDWLQQLFVSNRSYPFLTCCNSSSFRTGLILSSRVATALRLGQVLSFPHVLQQVLFFPQQLFI